MVWWLEELRLFRRNPPIFFIVCRELTPERLNFGDPESVPNELNTLFLDFCPYEVYGHGWVEWLQAQLRDRLRGTSVIWCPHFDESSDDSESDSDDSDDSDDSEDSDDPPSSFRARVMGVVRDFLEFLTPINNFFHHYYYRFF